MRARLLATISIGLLSAACQSSYSQNTPGAVSPAYGTSYQSSNAACADYGFRAGTSSFDQCVAREQQAHAAGRASRDYATAQLTSDARYACSSYGLAAGTPSYDRCLSREVDARSWRSEAVAPVSTYYTDQNGQRIDAQGYRVDVNGQRLGEPAPYRLDQYNNRIDAEGYRIDSSGRRMTVQSPYYSQEPQAYSSQAVSRDEFGNRYDAQGNRVDAGGRIIATPAGRR
jgi:hypothetical protein